MARDEKPFALCWCGTPLVVTFEQPGAEWYCVTCEAFFDWFHARQGDGPNPTPELDARYEAAKAQYDAERAARAERDRAAEVEAAEDRAEQVAFDSWRERGL